MNDTTKKPDITMSEEQYKDYSWGYSPKYCPECGTKTMLKRTYNPQWICLDCTRRFVITGWEKVAGPIGIILDEPDGHGLL